jgi:hypothetical protein
MQNVRTQSGTRKSVTTRWRAVVLGPVVAALVSCGLGEALSGDAEIVARAGNMELHRDTLAAVLASGKSAPDRRDVVEQWAFRWVEFALLGQRLAAGDSLLDTATVFHAMWPEADQWLVDDYHDALVTERVRLDSAVVDSAFAAGDQRIVYHVLIRTTPDMSPPDKQAARGRAGQLLSSLNAGRPWTQINEQNEDPTAKQQRGSLGVIERGQMVQPFEEAAFALAPGARSDLVETQFGYHIIWRPTLTEVRAEYEEAVEEILVARMDSVFLAELEARWDIEIRSNGPAVMREAAASPLRAFRSSDVVGTYKGGKFTAADFLRWLQVLPDMVHQGLSGASDEQLVGLAQSLIRNDVLVREARESGVVRMDEDYPELRDKLQNEIQQVAERIGFDTAFVGVTDQDERRQLVDDVLRQYYYDIVQNVRGVVVVPAFLADKLRSDMKWDVSAAGVDQTLEVIQVMWSERRAREDALLAPTTTDSANDEPPQ